MYKVNSGAYTAQSVSANTDITANLIPENAYGFKLIAFEINCSAAAEIALNGTDSVVCAPASSGYTATVNMGGEFFVDIEKIKIVDACDINGLTYYYTVEGFDEVLYAPVVTPVAGDYPAPLTVNITSFNEGAEIYYSVGGGDPDTLYTEPLTFDSAALADGVEIKAVCKKAGHYVDSSVTTVEYGLGLVPLTVSNTKSGTSGWIMTVKGGEGTTVYYKVDAAVVLPKAGTDVADLEWQTTTLAGGTFFLAASALITSGRQVGVVQADGDGKVKLGGTTILA